MSETSILGELTERDDELALKVISSTAFGEYHSLARTRK